MRKKGLCWRQLHPRANLGSQIAQSQAPQVKQSTNNQTQSIRPMSGVNNQWLNAFQEIQKNALEAQKHFQETLAQSHKLFLETSQMAFQQLSGLSGNAVSQTNVGAMNHVPQQPQAIISQPQPRVHIEPVVEQRAVVASEPIRSNGMAKVASQPVYAKAEPQQKPAANINIEDAVLTIVAEKTGYPKEILDLATDLESGLGIDSIKRVEILSAIQEVFPELKHVDKARLAAMHTLGEIIDFSRNTSSTAATSSPKEEVSEFANAENASVPDDFEDIMLQVVADKTGYPKEIIDLDTDLESGLGIDSIKRVEILSALQEKFPVLKNADKARLAAMKTLGEILAFADSATSVSDEKVTDAKKKSPRRQLEYSGI
jgi:acyl carrier protein